MKYSLVDLNIGQICIITHMKNDKDVVKRLITLGIRLNAEAKILHKNNNTIVLNINGTKIGIANKIASLIEVKLKA